MASAAAVAGRGALGLPAGDEPGRLLLLFRQEHRHFAAAQKVFITWNPSEKIETFTVQPKFEGNALDFGMVIPTPSQPKLHEMPRDFFKHLAVYTIMKRREFAAFEVAARPRLRVRRPRQHADGAGRGQGGHGDGDGRAEPKPTVIVLEAGVVGSLDYKIIEADRADDLFTWLKDNKYSYSGDEATLNYYVQKKWLFTVMKIDTMQMKRNKDGTFAGEVTPTRFQFASEKLVYPLKITQISVREKTEALFYVQAPFKVDLPGDLTYQYTWVPMLQAAIGCTPGGIPGGGEQWLETFKRADSAAVGARQRARLPLLRRPTAAAEQQGAHPDHDGMGPQAVEERHRRPRRQGPLQRKGAERGRRLHRRPT